MDVPLALVLAIVVAAVLVTAAVAYLLGRVRAERTFAERLREARVDAAKRSRAVIGGQFSEQLAPYLPGFPYRPTEVKFLGKPTDFVVFEGLDEKRVTAVVFVEVKSGGSRLSDTERSLREAVTAGRVRFETYRVPEPLVQAQPK